LAPVRSAPARLHLRPAGARDAAPLGFFFDTCLRKDYFLRRGQLEDLLRSIYHRVYIAEIDRVLVGVAIVTRGTRLVNALVHPAYRGLGIGRALVCGSGVEEVRVKLDMSTGDPRGFYRALGFGAAERVPGKDHIAIMRRTTAPAPDPKPTAVTCGAHGNPTKRRAVS
jgi:GNAT superfamily N-acetyltransferase